MKHILILLLSYLTGIATLFAQEEVIVPEMVDVIPASPEAAQFLDRSNLEVNEFVGKPNLNIPIYTIKLNSFSWPIYLSYDAGGIKTEEVASWVGAGWTLNATGLIGRTVKQHPDELSANFPIGEQENYGYFSDASKLIYNSQGQVDHEKLTSLEDDVISSPTLIQEYGTVTFLDSLADGYIDTQPDLYHYSVGESSGKFYFTQDIDIVELKKSNMIFDVYPFKGKVFPNDLFTDADYKWILIDEKGIEYIFNLAEKTSVATQNNLTNETDYSDYQSSWYLTKIISSQDTLYFDYEVESHLLNKIYSENRKYSIVGDTGEPTNMTNQSFTTYGHRLKSISSNKGDLIEFIPSEYNRGDYDGKALDSIKIYKRESLVKTYKFHNSYFGETYQTKLRLDSLSEKIGDFIKPAYKFGYFSGPIQNSEFPGITNKEQDYWGYFNNNGSTTLIPEFKDNSYHFKTFTADRSPNLLYAKIGTLKKLIYPTGGFLEFIYELNEVYNEDKLQTYVKEVQASLGTFGTPNLDEEIFTIPDQTYGTLELSEIEGLGGGISVGTYVNLYRKNTNNQFVNYVPPNHSNQYANRIVLEAGDYKLVASNDGDGNNTMVSGSLEYELNEPGNEKVGGLRISEVKYFDDIENQKLVKHTKYHYTVNGSDTSSGLLFQKPYYGGYTTDYYDQGILAKSLHVNSYASKILSYQGSHVGYQEVTVEDKDLSQSGHGIPNQGGLIFPNGRKTIKFIAIQPHNTIQHPYVGEEFLEHMNGSIKMEEDYVLDSSMPIQRKEYFYHAHEFSQFIIPVKAFREIRKTNYSSFPPIQYSSITYKPSYQFLDSIKHSRFDEFGNELQYTTHYKYDKTILKPIKVFNINNFGEVNEKVMSWNNKPGLLDEIAEFEYNIDDINLNSLLNKSEFRKSYQKFQYHGTQLQSKYDAILNEPSNNFYGDESISDSLQSIFPQFQNIYFSQRDDNGNLIYERFMKDGDLNKYYQWDNKGIYPIAQLITNAVQDYFKVFNFEDDVNNISTDAATGLKSTLGNTTLSFTDIPEGEYFITYKAKKVNGNGQISINPPLYAEQITNEEWRYFRFKYSNSIPNSIINFQISTNIIVDDICIYPANAELNTYTYKDGRGVTSITDTNGYSVFYKYVYDSEGISITELDHDGNVLKKMETKYKNFDQ